MGKLDLKGCVGVDQAEKVGRGTAERRNSICKGPKNFLKLVAGGGG